MSTGLVVVSYGSSALLAHGLGRLRLDGYDFRVVLVDCWTSTEERRRVSALAAAEGWHLVAPSTNLGFGAGVNAGAAAALELGCDVVVALNPDVLVDTETLWALAEHVRADPNVVVSPRLLREDGRTWFKGMSVDLRTGGMTPGEHDGGWPPAGGAAWLTGACLVVHREAWVQLGGFDTAYFLYWEDVDLSVRWQRSGGALAVRQDLRAVHAVGGTQGVGPRAKSARYVYWNCRNRLLFAGLHLQPAAFLGWLTGSPRAALEIVLRGGRRALLRRPVLLLAAAAGTLSGAAHGVRAIVRARESPGAGT